MAEADFTPPPVDQQAVAEMVNSGQLEGELPPGVAETQAVFSARPILEHLWKFADCRNVSPWAVLGVVLARVVAATEPNLVTPALIGKHGSLNMFVGLVGLSGQGKGAAFAAGMEAVDLQTETAGFPIYTPVVAPGSGEGLVRVFCPPKPAKGEQNIEPAPTRVMVNESEITNMSSLGGRTGATLVQTLLKMWSGELAGFTNADVNRTTSIEADSYRMCMLSQIQPGNAPALLKYMDSGLPQRFLWLPSQLQPQPTWQDVDLVPMVVRVPNFQTQTVMELPEDIGAYVKQTHRARACLPFTSEVDPMEAHRNMVRIKVSAALALLDERVQITHEDWELARLVLAVHEDTLQMVRDSLSAKSARRAEDKAETSEREAEAKAQRELKRAQVHVLNYLGKHDKPVLFSVMRKAAHSNIRDTVDMVMARWESDGLVTVERAKDKPDLVRPLTEQQRRQIEGDMMG